MPGQLQGKHFRAASLNLRTLHRAVVQEYEAVHSKLQFCGERSKIFGFGLPVDSGGNEMLPFENHPGVFLENPPNILFVILAAKAQQHPRVTLSDDEFLQRSDNRARRSLPMLRLRRIRPARACCRNPAQ